MLLPATRCCCFFFFRPTRMFGLSDLCVTDPCAGKPELVSFQFEFDSAEEDWEGSVTSAGKTDSYVGTETEFDIGSVGESR